MAVLQFWSGGLYFSKVIRFQAEARKSRRVQEQLAKKKREEIIFTIGIIALIALTAGGIGALVWWALFLKGN